MLEELKLIISLLDGVAGISANLVYAFLALKGLGSILVAGVIVYLARLLIMAILKVSMADISKDEANRIRVEANDNYTENLELKSKMSIQSEEHRIEMEKIKHLYKILKEAKDAG